MVFNGFDGHVWVVRNGVIIDPGTKNFASYDFPDFTKFKYLEAPPCVQDEMLRVLKLTAEDRNGEDWEKKVSEIYNEPKKYTCFYNAVAEVYINGGELKFGSLGVVIRNKQIHWWFGAPEFTTYEHFNNASISVKVIRRRKLGGKKK